MSICRCSREVDDDPRLAWDEAICASMLGLLAADLDDMGVYYGRAHALIVALTAEAPTPGELVSLFSLKGNLVWYYVQRGDHEAAQREHRARVEIYGRLERCGVDPGVLAGLRQQLGG